MIKVKKLRQFNRESDGNSTVEFALIIPLFLLLLAGVFEISMYSLLQNKLTRIAGSMSQVISTQNISRDKLLAIMGTANIISDPFDIEKKGGVIVTQVINKKESLDPANMTISWQEEIGVFKSKFGTPGSSPENLPNDITVIEDQALIITEVYYSYKPIIFSNIIGDNTLYKTSTYVPRLGNMATLLDE